MSRVLATKKNTCSLFFMQAIFSKNAARIKKAQERKNQYKKMRNSSF